MIHWLRSLFAWRLVEDTGCWRYEVNTVTGARRIVPTCTGGYQPVDRDWLRTGEWTKPGKPPFGGSGVKRPR
jgi:hypothetical protein